MPLFNATNAHNTLIWHQGERISRGQFVHAAQQLADQLADQVPDATHAINLCNSRLAFMLGFVAAALRQQMTLLPPNQTEAAIKLLQEKYPRHHIMDDECMTSLDWHSETNHQLHLDNEQVIVTLFTSGSTGTPQPHDKTWHCLARTGELDAQCFVGDAAINLVATVPSQHMFGLQTTVLLPLMSRCAIHDSRPFFPADIRAALAAVPAPRALIITPAHLRTCVASNVVLPEMEFILSATAPMPATLAAQAEALWHTKVLEIYGSTEAGTMATRRSTDGNQWQLMADAHITTHGEQCWFTAAHLPAPLLLSDQLQLLAKREFRLLGRASEQLKIAGKRASLAELTHALLHIPGVRDGVIFMPADSERTAALVVSDLPPAQILDALMRSIDPVFLPRPLLRVTQLPRNEVGKLTQAALQAALYSAGRGTPHT
jgi:acyl-coenzyme A synthetase/AMP-(fatty) acid ligase